MKVDIKNICLNKIVVDPTFTSEVARSNRATKSDHELVLDYIRLQEDLSFIDLIRVFEENGSYFLASNFACYEAHKRIYSEDPLKEIACLIFSDTTKQLIKIYCERINELSSRSNQTHLDRIVSIKSMLLADSSLAYDDFKRFRNLIGKSQSKDAKKLERDFKIARSDFFYMAIMGHESFDPSSLFFNPDRALYTYEFCSSKILPILGDNVNAIKLFHEKLQHYIKKCREVPHQQDYDYKAIYKWKGIYNKEEVINLAKSSLSESGSSPILSPDIADFDWTIEATNETLRISMVSASANSLERKDLKRIVEICYKASQLNKTMMAVLDQFRPYAHGDLTKIRLREGTLFTNGRSDLLSNSEYYLEFIRRNKCLVYANLRRLFNSIKLEPDHFGFSNRKAHTKNTYKSAHAKFLEWYKDEFIGSECAKIALTKAEDHPRFLVYNLILNILKKLSLPEAMDDSSNGVELHKFTVNIFKRLFDILDGIEQSEKTASKEILDLLGPSFDKLIAKTIEASEVVKNEN